MLTKSFEAINVSVNPGDVDVKAASIVKNLKNIQGLARLANRKSIMTMAAPGMYQYPLIGSSAIDPDVYMHFVKAYQLTFASSVAVSYSLNGIMDRSETPQISDFVKKFHNNDPGLLGANIRGAQKILGIESDVSNIPEGSEITLESATVVNGHMSTLDRIAFNLAMKDDRRSSLIMESLNDQYKPFERSKRILNDRIKMMNDYKKQIAREGILDSIDAVVTGINGKEEDKNATGINPGGKVEKTTDRYGKTMIKRDIKSPIMPSFKNDVVKNTQLDSLEPTMIHVQIVAHGGKDANGRNSQSVHNITLGVKVMPRLVKSDLMIASMIEACQNSHGIFKFLKWTKGELKTLDVLFGISKAKSKALERSAKDYVKFLEQSKKRKGKGLIGKFMNNEALPIVNIVITTYEAAKIKEVCGVDLTDIKEAIRLMNKYYLLSFGIYDVEHSTLQILFDCDTDWGYTTIGAMKSASNNVSDVLNANAVMKLFGRR